MSFQTPVSVEQFLAGIHSKSYLLPAIQREFVWSRDQIRRLVDSLLRGYPIGSFLLWQVKPATAASYTFYDFLTDYHERDHPFAGKAAVPAGQGIHAVLDGQQRLTSLNIAIYGTHSEKKKYAWWTSSGAFPKKALYLNLMEDPKEEELGFKYDLRFLASEESKAEEGAPDKWFRVGDVLAFKDSGPAIMKDLVRRGLGGDEDAFSRLYNLYEGFRVKAPINYYLETSQDPDKVLEIFVRVNSGGTTLSYSDLLLSMATNQWRELDAREEVRNLVQELNTGGSRQFEFSKDVVLKTALMIAGVDTRFRVSNFTQENMSKVEKSWQRISTALVQAATLLSSFGYSSRTLTADSVIIPLAYYIARRDLKDSYLVSTADASDRAAVQLWVTRSLVKRGIWGSGLDTLLARLRQGLDGRSANGFPSGKLESEMASLGKSLVIEETEVDELLQMRYGGPRTFATLSLLYPGLDFSKQFHEDHVFPKSRFSAKRLVAAGVAPEDVDEYTSRRDLLPNLQLLQGVPNVEKRDKLPVDWVREAFTDDIKRSAYLEQNDLEGLDLHLLKFLDVFEARKSRMRDRIVSLLGPRKGESPEFLPDRDGDAAG